MQELFPHFTPKNHPIDRDLLFNTIFSILRFRDEASFWLLDYLVIFG